MASVETLDPGRCRRQQRVVAGQALGRGVQPIGEQGEPKVAVGVRQVVDLQPADLFLDVRFVGQEGGHDDERAHAGRHAVGQLEARQRSWTQHVGDRVVDQGDGQIRRRRERQQRDHEEGESRFAIAQRHEQRHGEDGRRDEAQGAQIAGRRAREIGPAEADRQRQPNAQGTFERRPTVSDQEVAGIALRVRRGRIRGAPGHLHGALRYLDLGPTGTPGELFDGVPVAIARREVHLAERTIGSEDPVDQADALDESGPVEPGDEAHARDHVSDRHVHRRLPLVLQAHGLLRGRALRREDLLEPTQSGRYGRVLIAKPLEELDTGGGRQSAAGEPAQGSRRRLCTLLAEAQQAVGDLVGSISGGSTAHDLLRHAAQVLDQEDPQAGRDRPELAHRQRLHALERGYEATQTLGIEAAVRVRDIGPGHIEDSRVSLEVPVGELGQLAIVVRGQIVADLAQLLIDDMEVVNEPFGGRRDRSFVLDRPGQNAIRLDQRSAVLGDPRADGAAGTRFASDRLGGRQRLAVLLQAFDAEQLGDDGFVEPGRLPDWPPDDGPVPGRGDGSHGDPRCPGPPPSRRQPS